MALYEIIINVQESPPEDDQPGSEWIHLVNMTTRDRTIAAATLKASAEHIEPFDHRKVTR